jgi:hypothetical protein
MSQDSPVLAAALRYAAAGVAVFPARLGVRGDGKKDVRPIDLWKEVSSTDPGVIRGWFGQGGGWTGAALCIDCGKSGIVGVDQDVHEGKDGVNAWRELAGPLVSTYRVMSPTGGLHDYYRADPDHPFTVDNTGAVADGVDIRGMGGFLFAPPTVDPRGGWWAWAGDEPDWTNLPPVPAIVIERMEATGSARRRRAEVRASSPEFSAPANSQVSDGSEGSSLLFGGEYGERDFGPDGGWKSTSAAVELLKRETDAFVALTKTGSSRSHILSQRLGPMAGRGVPEFWSYETALSILTDACAANGFSDANGETYAVGQAVRGLEYGMSQPWHKIPDAGGEQGSAVFAEVRASSDDAVERMMAKLLDRDQLIDLPDPKPLVEDLLDLDSESWIIGASGGFKSFVALDVACHVANGLPWRGKPVQRGEVIYIVAEGAKGIKKRVTAWEKTYEHRAKGLMVLPEPVQVMGKVKGELSPDWQTLIEVVRRRRPVLVVIDTQARVTVGLNENDNGEMNLFILAVTRMKQAAGSCVLVVHHTGRSGGDARGASAIDAAQDTELKVVRPSGRKRAELTAEIVLDKQKDDDDRVKVDITMRVVELGLNQHTGKPMSSLALEPWDSSPWSSALFKPERVPDWKLELTDTMREVLMVMEDHAISDGVTQAEMRTWINERRKQAGNGQQIVKSTVSSAVRELMGEGALGPDGQRRPRVMEKVGSKYRLIEDD